MANVTVVKLPLPTREEVLGFIKHKRESGFNRRIAVWGAGKDENGLPLAEVIQTLIYLNILGDSLVYDRIDYDRIDDPALNVNSDARFQTPEEFLKTFPSDQYTSTDLFTWGKIMRWKGLPNDTIKTAMMNELKSMVSWEDEILVFIRLLANYAVAFVNTPRGLNIYSDALILLGLIGYELTVDMRTKENFDSLDKYNKFFYAELANAIDAF